MGPKYIIDELEYTSGQYIAVGFKRNGRPSTMSCFSIVSSPKSDELQIGVKVHGNFTRSLSELMPGDDMIIQGPFGSFIIDEDYDKEVILIAGGIGITPFMSMIRYASETRLTIPITLLYSNNSQANIPFYDELLELERTNPLFRVVFFITGNQAISPAKGRVVSGRINEERLNQIVNEQYDKFTFFICGPSGFMAGIKKVLNQHNTDPDHIVTEDFSPTHQVGSLSIFPKTAISRWTYILTGATLVLGTIFIMTLDVVRALPKINAITKSENSSQTNSGSSTNSSVGSSTTSTSGSQTTTTTPTTQSQYQSPITSVS